MRSEDLRGGNSPSFFSNRNLRIEDKKKSKLLGSKQKSIHSTYYMKEKDHVLDPFRDTPGINISLRNSIRSTYIRKNFNAKPHVKSSKTNPFSVRLMRSSDKRNENRNKMLHQEILPSLSKRKFVKKVKPILISLGLLNL